MPKFKHDCDACMFLGHSMGNDHYLCWETDTVSLVARDGNTSSQKNVLPREVVSRMQDDMFILKFSEMLAIRAGM